MRSIGALKTQPLSDTRFRHIATLWPAMTRAKQRHFVYVHSSAQISVYFIWMSCRWHRMRTLSLSLFLWVVVSSPLEYRPLRLPYVYYLLHKHLAHISKRLSDLLIRTSSSSSSSQSSHQHRHTRFNNASPPFRNVSIPQPVTKCCPIRCIAQTHLARPLLHLMMHSAGLEYGADGCLPMRSFLSAPLQYLLNNLRYACYAKCYTISLVKAQQLLNGYEVSTDEELRVHAVCT